MTMHGLDCRFLEVAGIFMFTITVFRMALKPTWPPVQKLLGTTSLGVKYKTGHPFFPNVKVNDVWRFAFIPPYVIGRWCYIWKSLTFNSCDTGTELDLRQIFIQLLLIS
jgi:hypothetical protein